MPKKIINDIIVSKKSIRQIPISIEKKKKFKVETEEDEIDYENSNIQRIAKQTSWKRKPVNPKFMIWLIAIICLLALFFSISILFSSATVIISPKIQNISFDNDLYTAKTNSTGLSEISFEVLNIKQQVGEIVEATEEKEVSQKATGKIIIYNNYSSVSQRLINNTRFEAKNGKVYRINSSVIVPGYKKDTTGKVIPGSVEATVFADQAGEGYNLLQADLTGDFKIPGFKGDPRYDSFYALLKEDIVGGFIGLQRIVADGVRATTEEIIKTKLKEQLLKELYASKPENYLFFQDGYSIAYSKLLDTAVDNNSVKINIEGSLNGIVFNNSKLAKYIADKKITDYDGLAIELIPTENLTVTFTGDDTNLWKNDTLKIKLDGEAIIKWVYDVEAIKNDLAGKKEAEINNILNKYKNSVTGIQVIFRPVWTRYFPDNTNKIKIQEQA